MDLFKDDDSSSSDENDQIQNAGGDITMGGKSGGFLFDDTAKIMPLSKQIYLCYLVMCRASRPDSPGGGNEGHE